VPYDVAATVAALRRRRLPEEFSARLSRGSEMVRKTKEIVCVC
jgi:hypothetical protein